MNRTFSITGLEPRVECIKCGDKPDQEFLLLLCDHIVCIRCIDSYPELKKPGFDGVRCPCGLTTFFKVTEGRSSFESRNYCESSSRPSAGLIQSRKTPNNKFGSRAQTQYLSMEQPQYSAKDSERYTLQKSSYPVDFTRTSFKQEKHQKQKRCGSPQFVTSYPSSQPNQQNCCPNVNLTEEEADDYTLSGQLNLELKYLKVRHTQLMLGLERAYTKAAKIITEEYVALENKLKDLCLEKVVMESKGSSNLDFNKIFQQKYENQIFYRVEALTETLKSFCKKSAGGYRLKSPQPSLRLVNSCSKEKQPSFEYTTPNQFTLSKNRQPKPSIVNIYARVRPEDANGACRHSKKLVKKGGSRRKNVIIEI